MKLEKSKLALAIAAVVVGSVPLVTSAQQAPAASAVVATAPGKAMIAETVKASAAIVAIDTTYRIVTLKTAEGKVFEVLCGPEVKNFAQLKVGDTVAAQYVRALSLELKKAGAHASPASVQAASAVTSGGATPGAAAGAQVTVLADVTAVNAAKQTVTLRGPKGNSVDLTVRDPAQLANIKKGDQVEAVYTEAVAISVESAPAAKKK